jgi:cytoskeletal protein RodZ
MELKSKTTYIAATVLATALVASGLMMAFPLQTASAQLFPPTTNTNTNDNTNSNSNTNENTVSSTTDVSSTSSNTVTIDISSGPVRPSFPPELLPIPELIRIS